MLTTTFSNVVSDIPEKDKPVLSEMNVESEIERVPVPLAFNAESVDLIVDVSIM